MCSKILVSLLLKTSKSYPKLLSQDLYSHFKSYSRLSNLKQASILPIKCLDIPPNNVVYKDCVGNLKHFTRNGAFTTPGFVMKRYYCSNWRQELPRFKDLQQLLVPGIFKQIKHWILLHFYIRRYLDPEFNFVDFIIGSMKALETVSGLILKGDVENLSGLVLPKVIPAIEDNLQTYTLNQRQDFFSVKADDVFLAFPYEVTVMSPDKSSSEESQSVFVEISMSYYTLKGRKEFLNSGTSLQFPDICKKENQEKICFCNYRFIRKFTIGVDNEWTISAITHCKPLPDTEL